MFLVQNEMVFFSNFAFAHSLKTAMRNLISYFSPFILPHPGIEMKHEKHYNTMYRQFLTVFFASLMLCFRKKTTAIYIYIATCGSRKLRPVYLQYIIVIHILWKNQPISQHFPSRHFLDDIQTQMPTRENGFEDTRVICAVVMHLGFSHQLVSPGSSAPVWKKVRRVFGRKI